MTIYTDGVHLIIDGPCSADLLGVTPDGYDELHSFAAKVGLRRSWFQGDHYDLTTRAAATRAVAAGAVLIEMMDLGRVRMKTRRAPSESPGYRRIGVGGMVRVPWLDPDWKPAPLDPALAADKNTELMRRFAPGKRIGRRGGDHL